MMKLMRFVLSGAMVFGLMIGNTDAALLVGFDAAGEITDVSLPAPAGHVVSGVVIEGIAPTQGDAYAYLTTGPEDNGQGSSGIDRTGNGFEEMDVAIGVVSFSLLGPAWVGFDFDLLTSEVTEEVPDAFEIKLNGTTVKKGVVAYENGDWPIIPAADFDGVDYVGPVGESSVFSDGRLGWMAVDLGVLAAGDHELEFFVGDDNDDVVDTALLVDNLQSRPVDAQIPEPATLSIWGLMLVSGLGLTRFRRRLA
jgi:hypothetical protein